MNSALRFLLAPLFYSHAKTHQNNYPIYQTRQIISIITVALRIPEHNTLISTRLPPPDIQYILVSDTPYHSYSEGISQRCLFDLNHHMNCMTTTE